MVHHAMEAAEWLVDVVVVFMAKEKIIITFSVANVTAIIYYFLMETNVFVHTVITQSSQFRHFTNMN